MKNKANRSGLFLVLTLVFLPFGNLPAQQNDYVFEKISSDAGITFNAISSIVEDKYGFIWFGSNSGVYNYNTVQTYRYHFKPGDDSSIPSDKVTSLYTDSNGRLWVCTRQGVCFFNEEEDSFTRIRLKEKGEFLDNPEVLSISQYEENKYLILLNARLFHFSTNDFELNEILLDNLTEGIVFLGKVEDRFCAGTSDGKVFISGASPTQFHFFYNSAAGDISTIRYINNSYWIGFRLDGIHVVDNAGNLQFQCGLDEEVRFRLPNERVREIIHRNNGEIWIATNDGLSIISSEDIITLKPDSYNGLPHPGIFELYQDEHDGIWVGTWAGGLAYFSESNFKFPHVSPYIRSERLTRAVISSFGERDDGLIWIGSENMGLSLYNPQTRLIIENEEEMKSWPINRIKSIARDSRGNNWFGTLRNGLWVLEGNSFRRMGNETGIFASVLATEEGIWVGDREGGLIYYNPRTNSSKRYVSSATQMGAISSNQVWDVFMDSRGDLWVCTDNGLSVKRKNSEEFERYFYNQDSSSISSNSNYTITEDSNGKLWIGTSGSGIDIYDPESGLFTQFRLNSPIETADIYCILIDTDENIWFSSNQGIYAYYPQSNTLKHFTQTDGLLGTQYHPNSGFVSSSGEIYFGGGSGFNVIDPAVVKENQFIPDVYLSKLLINNTPLREIKPVYANSKFVRGLKHLELKHDQNSISFGFVANNYIKKDKNHFQYRIRNYQEDWIEVYHGTDVTLSMMPPGEYTLEVLASNNDDFWSKTPRIIEFQIHPPIWLSWYAYTFYFLVFIAGVYFVIRTQRFRAKTRADELLFSEKVKFFTNVSHEFRTPLTLILSPLDQLKKKISGDPESSEQVKIVKRNADRLLRLTNQLLDFRLIELSKSKLRADRTDLVALCKDVYDCFEFQVAEKAVNCIFNSEFKSLYLTVDAEKIDKIVYNLLSNALKYSSDKGQIILSLEQKELEEGRYANTYFTGHKIIGEVIEIEVRDNGKGIKPEAIPHIFERFYVDHDENTTGTGIGLHICQEYVRLHTGNIMVESKVGVGTSFIVNIPMKTNIEFEKQNILIQSYFDPLPEPESPGIEDEASLQKGKIILFAEDNDEMRVFTKKTLSRHYKTLTAKNGVQAFEIAKEVIPDIIISDIMMPGMDGLELTEKIRSTEQTEHIPIILLTALSDDQNKIESMTKGANAFLTKPVDESFLLARIDNILTERESLQKKYKDQSARSILDPVISDSFIIKAEKIVEANLQNPAFEIAMFASQLSLSKSSLQRKMKSSINMNPSEFIRDYRLKKSVELIKKGNLNIDEVAILVGFNSTSYFIRTFKSKYGKTPAAYKSDLKTPGD